MPTMMSPSGRSASSISFRRKILVDLRRIPGDYEAIPKLMAGRFLPSSHGSTLYPLADGPTRLAGDISSFGTRFKPALFSRRRVFRATHFASLNHRRHQTQRDALERRMQGSFNAFRQLR